MTSIDRDAYHRGPIPYLGWYLEGAFARPVVPRAYLWHATEDRGDGEFGLRLDLSRTPNERLEESIQRGLSACRGMIFLRAWRQGETRLLQQREQKLPGSTIRAAVLAGLFRLYEEDFADGDFQIDYEGVAVELGVPAGRVERAVEYLVDHGLVNHPGTLGRDWRGGYIWITSAGVASTEANQEGERDMADPQSVPNRVMVVHGRNLTLRDDLFALLRALEVTPVEWSQAVALTEKASPYVGEILEAAFSTARAVVVLLSGDDWARLRPELADARENWEVEERPQARPNVLFEAGMAFAVHPTRTILVEVGDLRPFSDVAGRHVLRTSTATWRHELAKRLETAGCEINQGGTDWLTVGRFELE